MSYSTSQKSQDPLASFRGQTVELYSQILKYQIKLAHQYARSGFFRFLRGLAVIDNWNVMLEDLKKKEEGINKILGAFGSKSLRTIEDKVSEIQRNAEKSLTILTEARAYVEVWLFSRSLSKSFSLNPIGY
jgi:hypothetical protein